MRRFGKDLKKTFDEVAKSRHVKIVKAYFENVIQGSMWKDVVGLALSLLSGCDLQFY